MARIAACVVTSIPVSTYRGRRGSARHVIGLIRKTAVIGAAAARRFCAGGSSEPIGNDIGTVKMLLSFHFFTMQLHFLTWVAPHQLELFRLLLLYIT